MRYLTSIVLLIFFSYNITFSQVNYNNIIIKKSMSEKWELDSIDKKGTFRFVSYKPVYFTAARWSNKSNQVPFTESGDFAVKENNLFNNIEAKFQISFKSKLIQDMFFGTGDLWMGFTQKAHWQVYNKKLSNTYFFIYDKYKILLHSDILTLQ